MIYVTGDLHGEMKRLHQLDLNDDDYLIVTGDFGFIWYNESDSWNYRKQQKRLDILSKLNYTILFVDGNHCNFNELYKYPIVKYKNGNTHKIRDNIYHLMRGEIFNIESNDIFVFGGAESTDKSHRVENVSWWKDELPSSLEYENGLSNLEKYNYKVDYIITHDTPYNTLMDTYTYKVPLESYCLNKYLQQIVDECDFKYLYHGHHHVGIDEIRVADKRIVPIYTKVVKLA